MRENSGVVGLTGVCCVRDYGFDVVAELCVCEMRHELRIADAGSIGRSGWCKSAIVKYKLPVMPAVVADGWAILIILLIASIIVLRVRWTFALLLFFVGPFIGTLIDFFVSLLALRVAGELGVMHLRDLLSFAFTVYLFAFPQALCPNGAFVGVLVLLTYVWLERFFNPPVLAAGRRLAMGVLIGSAVGGLFASLIVVLVLLVQQNTQFVEFVSGGVLDRLDFSEDLLISVCTGAVDGALIAILRAKFFRPKHLEAAVESATT